MTGDLPDEAREVVQDVLDQRHGWDPMRVRCTCGWRCRDGQGHPEHQAQKVAVALAPHVVSRAELVEARRWVERVEQGADSVAAAYTELAQEHERVVAREARLVAALRELSDGWMKAARAFGDSEQMGAAHELRAVLDEHTPEAT
ncbi:hypothetical protein [Kineococcus terrestris]|uniref:hypothetical protein n=1 Tax=Kineococcus terrestris TaxID=2044856 RepID=UPI0034DB4376